MRRPAGHIRERKPGSFEIRYSLGRDPATGKSRVATTTLRGKRADAVRELRRLLRTRDTGEHVDPTRMTVAKWLEQWLASNKDEVSPKTHERYTEIVENYLSVELGAHPIAKLTPGHIQTAYTKWANGGRRDGKEGGLSSATRRYIHHILRPALARAVEQQLIARNPADLFRNRLPKVERKEMTALSSAQSATLLKALSGSWLYWPAFIALATGMRRGEILALRWKNVDLDRTAVRVVESLEQTSAGLRFKSPKTDRTRSVALGSFVAAQLREHKTAQAKEQLALGVRQTTDTLVCCWPDGEPIQPRSLTHSFARKVSLLTGVPRVRFHDLRHTHATQLLQEGIHAKVAQERLGHSTIATTLDLYSHVTPTMQADAAARLDATFQSAISAAIASK